MDYVLHAIHLEAAFQMTKFRRESRAHWFARGESIVRTIDWFIGGLNHDD